MKATLSLLASFLFLSACTVGPDYARPVTPLPDRFATEGHETAAISQTWWRTFRDDRLNQLVETGLQHNLDLLQAAARIQEAEARVREVGSALFPTIDLTASGNRTQTSTTTAMIGGPDLRDTLKGVFSTAFELDFWGKMRRADEAARAQLLAEGFSRETLRLTLAGLIGETYLTLLGQDAQLKVLDRAMGNREESIAIARAKMTSGEGSPLEVEQALANLASLRARKAETVRQRELLAHQLAQLTGDLSLSLPPGGGELLPVPPAPPPGLPSALLDNRPDIRQAEAQLMAANANVGVAKAALFPAISLTGNLGWESQSLSDLMLVNSRIWSLGFLATLPVFDAGRRNARLEQTDARQRQALVGYQKTVHAAFREVNDALVTLRQAALAEEALSQATASATKALGLAVSRYEAGYSPYLEVLDGQRTRDDAQIAFLQNRVTRLKAVVALFKALGGAGLPEAGGEKNENS